MVKISMGIEGMACIGSDGGFCAACGYIFEGLLVSMRDRIHFFMAS